MGDLVYSTDTGIAGIRARELTVADIRALLKGLEAGPVDLIGETLLDGVTLPELLAMTDATAEALEALTPSQLRALSDVCREVNADFFGWRARIMTVNKTPAPAAGNSSAP